MSTLAIARHTTQLSATEGREMLARHGRSFWLASFFLASDQRDDAALVYAFCRQVDDLADEASDPIRAAHGLEEVREELRRDWPARAWVASLLEVSVRRRMSVEPALALVDGVASDLDTVRVRDDRELLRYCYRVAGAVGLLMCDVIGVDDPAAHPHAVDLGLGMQLTNICRDVLEDARMGRSYLPAARLEAAGTSADALVASTASPDAVRRVVVDLLDLAERYYASAEAGMHHIPWRARIAIRVAGRVYRRIGRRLLAVQGGDALRGRVVVPAWEKALVVLGALWSHAADALARALPGQSKAPIHDPILHVHLDGLAGTHVEAQELP